MAHTGCSQPYLIFSSYFIQRTSLFKSILILYFTDSKAVIYINTHVSCSNYQLVVHHLVCYLCCSNKKIRYHGNPPTWWLVTHCALLEYWWVLVPLLWRWQDNTFFCKVITYMKNTSIDKSLSGANCDLLPQSCHLQNMVEMEYDMCCIITWK